ncbi:MAG: hypothetical protein AAF328_02060 [Planctomycetota bacterium]
MRRGTMRTVMATGLASVLLGGLPYAAGCQTAATGVQRYPLDLQTTTAAMPDRVAAAAEATLREMGLTGITAAASQVDAMVVGQTAMGKEVKVTAQVAGATTSRVKVTHLAGMPLANAVIDGIEKRLVAGIEPLPIGGGVVDDAPAADSHAGE